MIAPSTFDIDLGLTSARSRLNLANMVDMASQNNIRVLVVGPPPTLDAERNRRIADLSAAYADVVTRRNQVYVDTFNRCCTMSSGVTIWRPITGCLGSPGMA